MRVVSWKMASENQLNQRGWGVASIPFNRPHFSGGELTYAREAFVRGHVAGNGAFTQRAHAFFAARYGMAYCLLTQSCTAALEMAALLANIEPGDEVIIPSFTFVSTANPFVLRGAKIAFADSGRQHPNIEIDGLESLITTRTRAIVPVHYGGCACDMDRLQALASRHGLLVIEDAAQAIDAYHRFRPLGCLGQLAAFSFHETKNIISGEGGMLVVNEDRFRARAEIVWEKGTNRSAFSRGEIGKYGWVDVGSSFLPSEITAAFLCAQLENLDDIQRKRHTLWANYLVRLRPLEIAGRIQLPRIPAYAQHNAHIFFIVCASREERTGLIDWLQAREIEAVFHYQALHCSPYYHSRHDGRPIPEAERYSDCLLRLPLYFDLTVDDVDRVCDAIRAFYQRQMSSRTSL